MIIGLRQAVLGMPQPMVPILIEEFGRDPFIVLISCLISLRAKDSAALPVCRNLFARCKTAATLLQIPLSELEALLFSIGFFRKKALILQQVCSELIGRFGGLVPSGEEDLLSIKGVGRKTANLVRGCAFGIPAICVDVHVHRISNRLGLVTTRTPYETELALQQILPQRHWIEFNQLLVTWGQNHCLPVRPQCSTCPLMPLCMRKGVKKQ